MTYDEAGAGKAIGLSRPRGSGTGWHDESSRCRTRPCIRSHGRNGLGLRQLTPEQRRDYFKPGGQVEKDTPGVRQQLHDAEINRAQEEIRQRREGPQFAPEGRCSPRDPNYPAC